MPTLMSPIKILFLAGAALAATTNHKPHVHGIAKLALALESPTQGTIDLDVPAESIYGFEHKPGNQAEKDAQAKGFRLLRENPSSLVTLPPDCAVKTKDVGLEKPEPEEKPATGAPQEHHGEHADVNASYEFQCAKPLTGAKVRVGLFALFPRLKAVSLDVLGPSGQSETKVQDSHAEIALP